MTEELARANPSVETIALFIDSVNEVINLHTQRLMAVSLRIPSSIWLAIYSIILLSFMLLGFQNGLSGNRNFLAITILIVVFAGVVLLLVDLDRPTEGLFRVSQQALTDLINGMNHWKTLDDKRNAMTAQQSSLTRQSIRTPRAAAIAGILFAVLFGTSLVLIRLSIPSALEGSTVLLERSMGSLTIATSLMPYAGIAFLWFIGVVRDHLGVREDKFFSTVFLGSGLLFLAMTFSAAAVASGLIASYASDPPHINESEVYSFGRAVISAIFNVFAIRMGGVFMVSSGTIWARSKAMPRWLVYLTYALALILLVSLSLSLWVTLIFPAWVFVISAYILVINLHNPQQSNLNYQEG
jgi:hypothetical protein